MIRFSFGFELTVKKVVVLIEIIIVISNTYKIINRNNY